MKVLVVDHVLFGGLLLAQRLSRDGHEVVYATNWGPKSDGPYMDALGRGLPGVTLAPDGWINHVKWADLAAIPGCEHKGNTTAYLRGHGVPVCGPGRWAVNLELNRSYGHEVFREIGLRPTESRKFVDADEAIKFILANPARYILKVDQASRAFGPTRVGSDPIGRDLIEALRDLGAKLRFADGAVAMYLDDRVPGTDLGLSGWFNGKELVGDLMVSYKGTHGGAYDFALDGSKFVNVKRLEATLAKYKYRGAFDIQGFLTPEQEFRPLEWSPRWSSRTLELACHAAEDLGALLAACANGTQAVAVKPALEKKVGVLVDAVDESDAMSTPRDIVLPSEEAPPFFKADTASFWPMWPSKTKFGWMSLPVLGTSERRVGVYAGFGDDYAAASRQVVSLCAEAKIAGSTTAVSQVESELRPKLERGRSFVAGQGWIHRLAEESHRVLGHRL